MNNKPTIAAIIIFIISIILSFYITIYDQNLKTKDNDVEVYITKSPIEVPKNLVNQDKSHLFIYTRKSLIKSIKDKRRLLHSLVDSYEIEISDFWREVLNHFEIFEYYKAYPEAFIRRLIFMPTFTGIKEFEETEEERPLTYPDYDYRSIRYRVSLVPNTIEKTKEIIDFFYYRILASLGD